MATHSSLLAWKIPWTEDPLGLQPMGGIQFIGCKESDTTEHAHMPLYPTLSSVSLAWTPDHLTSCCFISNIYLILSELNRLFTWRPRLSKQKRVTLQNTVTNGFLNPQFQIKASCFSSVGLTLSHTSESSRGLVGSQEAGPSWVRKSGMMPETLHFSWVSRWGTWHQAGPGSQNNSRWISMITGILFPSSLLSNYLFLFLPVSATIQNLSSKDSCILPKNSK